MRETRGNFFGESPSSYRTTVYPATPTGNNNITALVGPEPEKTRMVFDKHEHPSRTVVILKTAAADGYRVGIVTRLDFHEGLRVQGKEHRLNPKVARHCFGTSPVYHLHHEAITAAEAKARITGIRAGVKLLHYPLDSWSSLNSN